MASRSRLLAVVALIALLFALPGSGLAGNPPSDTAAQPGSAARVALPGIASGPVLVPGAQVLTVGFGDTSAFDTSAGASLISIVEGSGLTAYSSSATGWVTVAPHLPAGSTIIQMDAYGFATGATTQSFTLWDSTASTGVLNGFGFPASSTGPGYVQSTFNFGGITLNPGHEWFVAANSAHSANNTFVGVVFQYTLPTIALVPITPVRVFDSRIARFGGPVTHSSPRTIDLKDAINPASGAVTQTNAIPPGVKAVSYNLTVTTTVGPGNIDLLPGASTTITSSSINWSGSGVTVANGGIIGLIAGVHERQVTLVLSGTSANAIVDITGYYW